MAKRWPKGRPIFRTPLIKGGRSADFLQIASQFWTSTRQIAKSQESLGTTVFFAGAMMKFLGLILLFTTLSVQATERWLDQIDEYPDGAYSWAIEKEMAAIMRLSAVLVNRARDLSATDPKGAQKLREESKDLQHFANSLSTAGPSLNLQKVMYAYEQSLGKVTLPTAEQIERLRDQLIILGMTVSAKFSINTYGPRDIAEVGNFLYGLTTNADLPDLIKWEAIKQLAVISTFINLKALPNNLWGVKERVQEIMETLEDKMTIDHLDSLFLGLSVLFMDASDIEAKMADPAKVKRMELMLSEGIKLLVYVKSNALISDREELPLEAFIKHSAIAKNKKYTEAYIARLDSHQNGGAEEFSGEVLSKRNRFRRYLDFFRVSTLRSLRGIR